jgi:hypothetical protein
MIGGGNCSLCGSPNTTKATCPLNVDAKNPTKSKHPLAKLQQSKQPKQQQNFITFGNETIPLTTTSLNLSIGKLTQLKELVLSEKKLKSLPNSIGKLKSLEYLDLSDNNLTRLPE